MFLRSTLLFLFVLPYIANAQRNTEYSLVTGELYPTESVNTFDKRERKQILQSFLIDEWMKGNLIFKGNHISKEEYSLKYDILNQQVNILMDDQVFEVTQNKIAGFILEDSVISMHRKFVLLNADQTSRKSIFEVVVQGKYSLLSQHYVEKLRSNYVPALDVGDLNEKLVNRVSFFFMDAKEGLRALPKKNKAAKAFFNKIPEAKQYLKDNKVNFKNLAQVKELVIFMNKMSSVKKS